MDTRTLCLGVLNRSDASGYEIKKSFEEGPLAHIHEASFGAIYPALTRLSEEGMVECREYAQDKRPDKKVYSLTAKGRHALEQALHTAPAPDKMRSDFLFMLFFAQLLPVERLAAMIDMRIALYEEMLERMTACEGLSERPAGERFVHGFGLTIYRTARDYLVENRAMLLAECGGSGQDAAE